MSLGVRSLGGRRLGSQSVLHPPPDHMDPIALSTSELDAFVRHMENPPDGWTTAEGLHGCLRCTFGDEAVSQEYPYCNNCLLDHVPTLANTTIIEEDENDIEITETVQYGQIIKWSYRIMDPSSRQWIEVIEADTNPFEDIRINRLFLDVDSVSSQIKTVPVINVDP